MAENYQRTSWSRGDTIASKLLNHMEEGIETAQNMASKANDIADLRAAFDMLAGQTRAWIRDLDKRLTALEEG